jgi:hypothetical protein
MVIGLPAVQPSGAVISETIEEMSEVTRSSCTFAELAGLHMTLAAVGVRADRSPAVVDGADDMAFSSP